MKKNKTDWKLKRILLIGAVILLSMSFLRPYLDRQFLRTDLKTYAIDFVDDSGYRVRMDGPAERIISLYSAHTENLFSLGLNREIIGVGTSDIYPYAVFEKAVYDYKSDPEKVIAANPDLVLIRPFIERHSPDFVNSLRRTGINVVSLYPDNFNDFQDYIDKLALLTGKTVQAENTLKEFYMTLDRIEARAQNIDQRLGVYFESSDREYKTVTTESMPAYGMRILGVENVAEDAQPIEEGSSIALYGIERILEKSDLIDVYITQRGVMGAGGNWHSISIRPGFDTIRAVQEKKVLEINQKIISSPTFRFVKGVEALQRVIYPELFDYTFSGEVCRSDLAEYLMYELRLMPFVPTSSYYKTERHHYYGDFQDVTVDHPQFDAIETGVQRGYFQPEIYEDQVLFNPTQAVTREEWAHIVFLLLDLKSAQDLEVADEGLMANPKICKAVIAAGFMGLENEHFRPKDPVTWSTIKQVFHDNM